MAHDWDDLTHYCKRCGCPMELAVDRNIACIDAPNVVAVSHLIAQKRMCEILASKEKTDASADGESVDRPCDT